MSDEPKLKVFTQEEREAILARARSDKAFEEKDAPVMDDDTTRYFLLKETSLWLDQAICEIGNQQVNICGAMVRLRDWEDPERFPGHKECADKLEAAKQAIKDANVSMMQVRSDLGRALEATFKLIYPYSEGDCPKNEPE